VCDRTRVFFGSCFRAGAVRRALVCCVRIVFSCFGGESCVLGLDLFSWLCSEQKSP